MNDEPIDIIAVIPAYRAEATVGEVPENDGADDVGHSLWRDAWRRLAKNRAAVVSAVIRSLAS